MTITVPLTAEQEAKLITIAEGRGVSPDAFIKDAVRDAIERSFVSSKGEEPHPDDREKKLAELFESFDSANIEPVINEEAFHRENWYR